MRGDRRRRGGAPPASDASRGADQPLTARELVRWLGLEQADPAAQEEGVARWLAEHDANRALRRSLEKEGLLPEGA